MQGSIVGVGSQLGNGVIGLVWIHGTFGPQNMIAAPSLPQEVLIGSVSVPTAGMPQFSSAPPAAPVNTFSAVWPESIPRPAMSADQWNQILQQWQQDMITAGQQTGQALQSATDWGTQLGMTYYDAARVYYQIAQYTGDSSWLAYAQTALHIYRDTYVLPNQGGIPGYWNFTKGLLMDYQQTGNPLDLQAIQELSTKMWNADGVPLSWTQSQDYSREVAYAIMSYINGMAVGQPAGPRMGDLINQALGHIDQWFVSQTALYTRPFMVGLTMQALIQAYGVTGDPRIPPAVQTALDSLWNQMWMPSAQAFKYTNVDTSTIDPSSPGYNTGGTEPAPDLNLLIAPAYAWMYKQTGNIQYLNEGDQIFAGGVQHAYLGDGKHFDQNYVWSFDYVKWRAEGQANA